MSEMLDLNTSTETVLSEEPKRNPGLLQIVSLLCACAVISQISVILIAKGLPGNYSGKTFLWVQSIGQILQQLAVMKLAVCGVFDFDGVFCIDRTTQLSCKFSQYATYLVFVLPDFLAVPVSLDRLNAVLFPAWYSQKCTKTSAWKIIVPIVFATACLASPKFLFAEKIGENCFNTNRKYDQTSALVGIPAVLIVAVSTLALLGIMLARVKKSQQSSEMRNQKPITIALAGSSTVFAAFGSIQYTILFLAYLWRDFNNPKNTLILMGMAQIVGSIGIMLRSPILLFMKPMRAALKRAITTCNK
ncbi:uncharacterized protein LOC134844830 [Symsagittifera roscoffensis]|uniref:uncharacterized protein LOC134844830 n=1 Tax=Symsagittifera roscoffensis TaxID=84072 RepID=UPI00307C539D